VTSLVERDQQTTTFDRLFGECAGKQGRVLLVTGPLGSGRTALLGEFARRAGAAGARHLAAHCSPAERALPFGVAHQLLRAGDRPGDRAGDVPALPAGAAVGPGDALPPDLVRACHELTALLLDRSADAPLLVTVDDLRDADVASLHFLLHLARRLPAARVLLVLADAEEYRPAHRWFAAELARQPHAHRLRLGPLSPAGTAARLAAVLGGGAAAVSADDFHAASGGSPLLLDALIEDHRYGGGESGLPAYGMALLDCLRRAGEPLLRTARALAVLGEDAAPEDVAALAAGPAAEPADGRGGGAEDVAAALAALTAAGLLDEGRFRHPAGRSAVLDDLSPAERAEWHRRAARLRHDAGAPALETARHLIAAGHAPARWGVGVLSEAAEHALLDDRVELAVACLTLAHRAAGEETARAGLRARLARAEWQLSPALAARHLAPLAEAVHAGRLPLADGLTLVRHLLWHGRTEEAADVLGRLRAGAAAAARPSAADAAALRDIDAWLAFTHPALVRDRPAPVLPAGLRHALVAPGTDPQLHAAAALADALARNRAAEAVDRAEQVLRDLRLYRRSPWAEEAAHLALLVLLQVDRTGAAATWSDRLLADAEARGTATARALFAALRAEIAVRQGDLTAAVRHARAALATLPPAAWGVAVALPLGALVLAATRMGEHTEAAKQLTVSVPEAAFRSRYGLHYLYARGHHFLTTSHPHAALADFLTCGELLRGWGLDSAGLTQWRTHAAEAWLRLGNRDQARRLIHEQLGRPDADSARARGPALRVLAAVGPAGRRLSLLSEAIDLAEASGDRFEQVRVLTELSRVHQAGNDRRRARLLLRQALHVANMCHMKPLARDLLLVSDDLGGADAGSDGEAGIGSLTDSERRVASLAVLGYTNREIALKLYITPSTVEQHLTRVYRKLGIRRRKDLPADLWANLRKTG
jgi:DNA-binding CsgD family transcriptional regulator